MTWKKLPLWIKSGILIFPVLIILSLLFGLITKNYLIWMIIPSIIFEEAFETCCYTFSNNQIANSLFILIFWFFLGALIGWLYEKVMT